VNIILGVLLIILVLFLGNLFWQLIKAKGLMKKMLNTPTSLSMFISNLYKAGYFSKKAEEVSETGGMWSTLLSKGAGYQVVIRFEAKSSMSSFNRPRNIISILILSLLVLGFFYLPFTYGLIALLIFILSYCIPLSESGITRVNKELSAMSWLLYQFNKTNPMECSRFFEQEKHLKGFHIAIAQLD
jgi:hypothetical protein